MQQHTRVSIVRIHSRLSSFRDLQVVLWNDLIHGERTASEDFASVAVATCGQFKMEVQEIHSMADQSNMTALIVVEFYGPFMMPAVAFALILRHGRRRRLVWFSSSMF